MRISDWSSDVCSSDLLVTFHIYSDAAKEAAFNAIAGGLFILPFFLFSALAGQLADGNDKARIIRIVKTAEIAIMLFGAVGLLLPSVTLLLAALFAMGVHSAFFGPIRSEEHTSELQTLMRISYAVFCLKKKTQSNIKQHTRASSRQKID